jgi:LemA protein
MSTELWIVVLVVVALVVAFIVARNAMIALRNRVDEAWSGVDVQLKRRHDLVPNLVETVKGYAQHEREVFQRTTEVRAQAVNALGTSPPQEARAEAELSRALADVRAVAENYPDLRASENFQQLQQQLSLIENEIQASRRIYNSNTQAYNTKIQVFPNSLVASVGGMTPREFFEIEDAREREPVPVSFG